MQKESLKDQFLQSSIAPGIIDVSPIVDMAERNGPGAVILKN